VNIPKFAVDRPVTVIMLLVSLSLAGLGALSTLSIDLFPNIDFPLAFIQTPYPGVDPQEMENIVTRKIEEEINTVENIKNISSHSFEGFSWITVEFVWGTGIDLAAVDLREKVDIAKRKLPRDIEQVTVAKLDINAQPVIDISLGGDFDLKTLRGIADKEVKPAFERISGVANVEVLGGLEREIRVKAFPDRLKAFNLTLSDVIQAISQGSQNTPVGNITDGRYKFLIRSEGEVPTPKDLESVVVKRIDGRPVYVRELAAVYDSFKEIQSVSRLNRRPAVTLSLKKEAGANPIAISDAVKKLIPRLEAQYKGKMTLTIGRDNSEFIRDSLEMVKENAKSGSLLAVVVLFLFLWNVRSTIIVGLSIPLSVVITFGLMYLRPGMTLNLMTLGGLALGIGMMVDNSVVVLENIYRLLGIRGENDRRSAAIDGADEVALPILASTLTTVAVFLPIGFVPGIVGEIFLNMSLAIVFSLMASYLVAIFLVPLLCSQFLKLGKVRAEPIMDRIKRVYRWFLSLLLWNWGTRLLYFVGVLGLVYFSLKFMPAMEFFPKMDRGVFVIQFEPPEGTSLEATDQITGLIEIHLQKISEVEKIISNSKLAEGNITVVLKPKAQRERTTNQVISAIRPVLAGIAGINTIAFSEPSMGGPGGGKPVQVEVSGPDFPIIEKICLEIAEKIKNVAGLRDIDSGVKEGRPEIKIEFDRARLGDLDVSLAGTADMVRGYIFGTLSGNYREKNEEFDVRVEIADEYKDSIPRLNDLEIALKDEQVVSLSQIARIYEGRAYTKISRRNLKRLITVQADIQERPLQAVILDIQKILPTVDVPAGYEIRFGGEEEERVEAFRNLAIALLAAVLLVYMIMASQFESFSYPFVIMFTIPLSIMGVIIGLNFSGFAFSITAMIGIIMLAGIVVNNGIILIDNIIQRREKEGVEKIPAVLDSGETRLRPILMTVLTTVLGMLPLAMGIGAGSDFYQPLAISVIGGLTVSTILTLTYIPVVYTLVDDIVELMMKVFRYFK
jgi:HAE1 family hydrophobic/amphiphilic exporter-1